MPAGAGLPQRFTPTPTVTPRPPVAGGAGLGTSKPVFEPSFLKKPPSSAKTVKVAGNQAPFLPGKSPTQQAQKTANSIVTQQGKGDARVVAVQQHLVDMGYHVQVDGVMGPETRAAMWMSHNGTVRNAIHSPQHADIAAQKHVQQQQVAQQASLEAAHTMASNVRHYQPFTPGQKPTGIQAVWRNPDGSITVPGEGRPQLGATMHQVPYYTPPRGPGGDAATAWNAAQLAQANAMKTQNEGLGQSLVEGAAQAIPGVSQVQKLAAGQSLGAGDAASVIGNAALWGTAPVDALMGAARAGKAAIDAFHEEGITANALRTIREARSVSRSAAADAQDLKRSQAIAKTTQRLEGPVQSPVKDQIAQALAQAPNITPKQTSAILEANDVAARAVAHQLSGLEGHLVTPEQAYERMWGGAQFHDVAPTIAELRGQTTLAQTATQPEVTNLAHTPDAIHPADEPQLLAKRARNLSRSSARAGAPPHAQTPAKMTALLRDLQRRAIEASQYRQWYRTSADGILQHTGGNVEEAKKLAALIAVYSPRAEVYSTSTSWNNLDRAINAFDDFQREGKISPKWSISSHKEGAGDWQTTRAEQIMRGDYTWNGLKTNRFYRNFLQHIDPEGYTSEFGGAQFTTQDTWMRRAFDYPTTGKAITPKMYDFMDRATKAVAESLGWTPEEAQAAIWTSIKSEAEGTPLARAGFDFNDAFNHRIARDATRLDSSPLASDAATAAREPDGGFTLRADMSPDNEPRGFAVAHGAHEERVPGNSITEKDILDYRNRKLDLLKGNSNLRIGGWHNPEDGQVYLDLSEIHPTKESALEFARNEGQLAIFDRESALGRGDWENAFPESGLSPESADAIKAQRKTDYASAQAAKTYDGLLADARMIIGGKVPSTGRLTPAARKDTEDFLFDWAHRNPETPEAQKFLDLYHTVASARNAPDPEVFFQQDNPLLKRIAQAQGLPLSAPKVKGAVTFEGDAAPFLHLFRGADVSTALHELAHSVEQFVPAADRALLAQHGLADEETFARSFERYIAEGALPDPSLRKTFRTLARGVAGVYGDAAKIPLSQFNPEIRQVFDRFFARESTLDPRFAKTAAAHWFAQEGQDPQQAMLEAAGWQVTHGHTPVDEAARMFGLDPKALEAHLSGGGQGAAEARMFSNADVGAGAAETTQSADDIFSKWFPQVTGPEDGSPFEVPGPEGKMRLAYFDNEGTLRLVETNEPLYGKVNGKLHMPDMSGFRDRLVEAVEKPERELTAWLDANDPHSWDDVQEQIDRISQGDDLVARRLHDKALEWRDRTDNPEPVKGPWESDAEYDSRLSAWEQSAPSNDWYRTGDSETAWQDSQMTPEQRTTLDDIRNAKPEDFFAQEETPKPEEPSPIDQLRQGMKGAASQRGKQEAMYSDERSQRATAAESAMRNVGGVAGYHAAMEKLKGELPKIDFGGFKELSPEALDALFSHIQEHPNLRPFQKVRAQSALMNAVRGRVPTRSEITLLENVFGKETARGLAKTATLPQHIKQAIEEVINIPRSLMASFDMSAPFRQGLVVGARYPRIFVSNFRPMVKAFGSEKVYEGIMDDIASRPTFPMMQQAKLALTDMGALSNREEQFYSNLAEKIPVAGRGVKASERAYQGFLNKTRADVFDHLVERFDAAGYNMQDKEMLRGIGTFINSATGRGDLGALNDAAIALNSVFFSPRLLASRLNFMNPLYYSRLPQPVRMEALKSALALTSVVATVLGLARAGGLSVNMDPRNADFAKIRSGPTRLDILGGFQQPIRLLSQIVSGKIISSTTGDPLSLGPEGPGKVSRKDIIERFFEGKLAPVPSVVYDWTKGTNFQGQKFSWSKEAQGMVVPLLLSDVKNLYDNAGGGVKGVEEAAGGEVVGGLGVGLQSYQNAVKVSNQGNETKLQKEAKAAGIAPPDHQLLIALDHKTQLDKIGSQNKGNEQAKLKAAIKYYQQQTGRHDFDKVLKRAIPDSVAATIYDTIRTVMIGPGLAAYEGAVKDVTAAKKEAGK